MKILITHEAEFDIKFKDVRDQFPEEYSLDKEAGLTDREFVHETISEIGIEETIHLFGKPKYEDYGVEVRGD